MNLQSVREQLAGLCEQLLPGWIVTTRTWPDLNATYMVQIGHAPVTPHTLSGARVDLPVVLWVNEANDDGAAKNLYEAISYDAGTFLARLEAQPFVIEIDVVAVGLREESPANYLAAELVVSCRSTAV